VWSYSTTPPIYLRDVDKENVTFICRNIRLCSMGFSVIVRYEVITVVTMKIFLGYDAVYSGRSVPSFQSKQLYVICVDLP
jgi:hypothetical protein